MVSAADEAISVKIEATREKADTMKRNAPRFVRSSRSAEVPLRSATVGVKIGTYLLSFVAVATPRKGCGVGNNVTLRVLLSVEVLDVVEREGQGARSSSKVERCMRGSSSVGRETSYAVAEASKAFACGRGT